MRLLTLASLATLSSASSGCWSEVISGRSPGANIVSKGYTHSSSASSAACQAYCETFSNCLAIIYAPGLQCTPIARVYESNYMSSSYQFVSNFVEGHGRRRLKGARRRTTMAPKSRGSERTHSSSPRASTR